MDCVARRNKHFFSGIIQYNSVEFSTGQWTLSHEKKNRTKILRFTIRFIFKLIFIFISNEQGWGDCNLFNLLFKYNTLQVCFVLGQITPHHHSLLSLLSSPFSTKILSQLMRPIKQLASTQQSSYKVFIKLKTLKINLFQMCWKITKVTLK